jgi:hypothetical protein
MRRGEPELDWILYDMYLLLGFGGRLEKSEALGELDLRFTFHTAGWIGPTPRVRVSSHALGHRWRVLQAPANSAG